MNEDKNIKKTVLITGGTGSIGRELVLSLAKNGLDVIFTYHSNLSEAQAIASNFDNVKFIKLDLANIDSINEVVDFINHKNNGQLDFLINNAAVTSDALFEKMSDDQIQKIVNIDLVGPMILTNKLIDHLKKSQGRIINIASVSGQIGNIGQANYSAAKGGLISFTKVLAKELGRFNVTVNAISPGLINSKMSESIPREIKEKIIKKISLNKLGQPEDIAELVLFLLTNHGNYITGQVINIDGGINYE